MAYILIGLLSLIFYLINKVNKLEDSIKGMKYTLEQVAIQLEIPENLINDRLRELLQEGEYVKAVKEARESLGLSLIEGKEYVDVLGLIGK